MRLSRVVFRNVSLALLVWCATLLEAQINRGTMEGVVTDPQGAIITGVDVAITSLDTNVTAHTATNGTGYYRVVDLVPGKYHARFSFAGFSTVDMTDLDVPAGKLTASTPSSVLMPRARR